MSSVKIVLNGIKNHEKLKQFLLSEAEYLIRDVDIDTDYELVFQVQPHHLKRADLAYQCRISLARPGHPQRIVRRADPQFYTCVRNASECFKKIIRSHSEIELGTAADSRKLC